MAPADENELIKNVNTAFTVSGPVAIRYPRGIGQGAAATDEEETIPIGQAKILATGDDLAVIGIGRGVSFARDLVQLAAEYNISATLVDARFVKPIDKPCIKSIAQKCGRIVTIEDNVLQGGFGSTVLEILQEEGLPSQILRAGIPDEFVEHGRVDILFDYLDMNAEALLEKVINRWPELVNNSAGWELLKFGES